MLTTYNEPRVLLIGASGQVGGAWQALLPAAQIVAAPSRAQLDLCQRDGLADALARLIEQTEPNLIVNAAAYTAVDRAEQEPELAFAINAHAPGVIARVAGAARIGLIHYSTDYVFDGRGHEPFTETDSVAPLSVYGRSKLAGENEVQAASAAHWIFRTSWVFGVHGQNFLKTMLRLAQSKDELRVVNDQFGAPTPASLLARLPLLLWRGLAQTEQPGWGLYHLCPSGVTSWHGYACYAIEQARQKGWPIKVQPQAIYPVTSDEFVVQATRPHNSRLATNKLAQALGMALPSWQQGVDEVLAQLEAQA